MRTNGVPCGLMHTVSKLSIKASWGLPDRRAWRNYGGALGLLIGVATLQGVLLPVADAAAYVLLYPLIVVISWWFGAGPGLLVLLLSAWLGNAVFVSNPWLALDHHGSEAIAALFLVNGLIVIAFVVSQRRTTAMLKASHHALQASQLQLQRMADEVPAPIVVYGLDGLIFFSNQAFKELLRTTSTASEFTEASYLNEPWYINTREYRVRAMSGETVRFTLDLPGEPNGRTHDICYAPYYDAQGVIKGVYGTRTDVTLRQRLHVGLEQSHHSLKHLLQELPGRVSFWGPDLTLRYANATAMDEFRGLGDKAYGLHWRVVLGEGSWLTQEPYLRLALDGVAQSLQILTPDADATGCVTLRCAHVLYVPERVNGVLMGLYAMAVDITALHDSHNKIRALTQRLEFTREQDRQHTAQVLHEGVAQDLFAATMTMRSAERAGGSTDASDALRTSIKAVRQIADGLRPAGLGQLGLTAVLIDLADRVQRLTGLLVQVQTELEAQAFLDTLTVSTGLLLFRAAEELLTNVHDHAQAKNVAITLRHDGDFIVMCITDDGMGMMPNALHKPQALGLLGLQERLRHHGGALTISAHMSHGTVVQCSLPWLSDEAGAGRASS